MATPSPEDKLEIRPALSRVPSDFYFGTSLAQRGVNAKLQYLLELMKLFKTAEHLEGRELNPQGCCFAYEATCIAERLIANSAATSASAPAELPTATQTKKSTIAQMTKVEMDLVSVLSQETIQKIQARDPQFLKQLHEPTSDPVQARYRSLLRELTYQTPLQLQHLINKRRQVAHLIDKASRYMTAQGDGVAATSRKMTGIELFCLHNLLGIYSVAGLRKMLSAEIVPPNCACALSVARHIVSFRPRAQSGWVYSDTNFETKVECSTFEEIRSQFARTLRSLSVSLPYFVTIEVIGYGSEPLPVPPKPVLYYEELFKSLQAGLGNSCDKQGLPFLFHVITSGDLSLVQQLLAYRSGDTLENFVGTAPRSGPLGKRQINVNIEFRVKLNLMNLLCLAIINGRTEIACELIKHPEINANLQLVYEDKDNQSREHISALHIAINKEMLPAVIALLQYEKLAPPDIETLTSLANLALAHPIEPLFGLTLEKFMQLMPSRGPITPALHQSFLDLCTALMNNKQYQTLATVLSQCSNACMSPSVVCFDRNEIAADMVSRLRAGTPLDISSYKDELLARKLKEVRTLVLTEEEEKEVEVGQLDSVVKQQTLAAETARLETARLEVARIFSEEHALVFRPFFESACQLIKTGRVEGLQVLLANKPLEVARLCELPILVPAEETTAEAKDAEPRKPGRQAVRFSSILQEIIFQAPTEQKWKMIEMIQGTTTPDVFSDMVNTIVPGHGTILQVVFAERLKAENMRSPDISAAKNYHRIFHDLLNIVRHFDVNRQNPQTGNTLLHDILEKILTSGVSHSIDQDLKHLIQLHQSKVINVDLDLANRSGKTIRTLAEEIDPRLINNFAPVGKLGPRVPPGVPPGQPLAARK